MTHALGALPMTDHNSTQTLCLSGTDWFIHEDTAGNGAENKLFSADTDAPGWVPAVVPGNVQSDLEAAHLIGPIWYGAGDPRLAAVAAKDWWYRLDFEVPESFAERRLKLIFDGVDHACEVWLNGRRIGANAGMFRRFGFDVADAVNPGGTNRLAVRIERMPAELADIMAASDGPMCGGKGPNHFMQGVIRTRQLLQDLKSPTNFGWDWGVNIYTLGIWHGVRLEATGAARIENVQVLTDLSKDHSEAGIRVRLDVDSRTGSNARAVFCVRGQGYLVETTVDASLSPGDNRVEAELVLKDPALWWPNGQGAQPLYELETILEDAGDGSILDARTNRFGVREIRWEQIEGAPPDFINPYQLIVNGRPVRMMGSNIIPPDLLFGRMNERGLRLIRMARQAGMNTLRVWGGGALLTDEMYDLADELGIMLSQEFPLANSWPEKDPVFLGNLETTASGIVKRLRNHPCIIEWSGGNEMPWNQGDDHPALHLLERVTADLDTRMFRATCPIQGARHGPWDYAPETHYAWYNSEAAKDQSKERPLLRYGEFGCHTPAHLEVWQREIPPKDRWPPDDLENPVLIRKNVIQAVFTEKFWLHKEVIDELFGPSKTIETVVQAGQYIGAHGLRYAVDSLRRRGKRIGGMTTWDYNEPWPNGAGSYLVDYDGRTLMNYDFMRQALAPVSLSLHCTSNLYDPAAGLDAGLWLVSDAPEPVSGLRWSRLVRDRHGRVLAQDEGVASIGPLEAVALEQIKTGPVEGDACGPLLVELRLADASGKLLAERVHLFGAAGSPAPLAGFLPDASPDVEGIERTILEAAILSHRVEDDEEVLQLELTNKSGMTALFCEPHPLLVYRTDLSIDNNNCFIPPGEKRTIAIRAAAEPKCGLSLPQTGWRISCWNACDLVIPPGGGVLLSVGRRDAMTREFAGHDKPGDAGDAPVVTLEGNRPCPSQLPSLMQGDRIVRFVFDITERWEHPARLRLHTADQHSATSTIVEATVNGRSFEADLSAGLGIQKVDPAHLAFPASLCFDLPAGTLKESGNILEIRIKNGGWFTWDSLDLVMEDT